MPDDTGNLGLTHGTDLAIQPLKEVESTGPELPSPTQVTDAMVPILFACKRRNGVGGVSDEAADGVGVECEEEWDKEMVQVPKCLEGLLPDTVVCRRVHQKHAEEHHMAGDAAGLYVMDLHRRHWPDLGLLDVVEANPPLSVSKQTLPLPSLSGSLGKKERLTSHNALLCG